MRVPPSVVGALPPIRGGVRLCAAWSGALDALHLPVIVKEGYVGRIELVANWAKLASEPVRVVIEDVFLIAWPHDHAEFDAEQGPAARPADRAPARSRRGLQSARRRWRTSSACWSGPRRRRLPRRPSSWARCVAEPGSSRTLTHSLAPRRSTQARVTRVPMSKATWRSSPRRSLTTSRWVAHLLARARSPTAAGRAGTQIQIRNIHIRYEDVSPERTPLCFGVALKEMTLATTDQDWKVPTRLEACVHLLMRARSRSARSRSSPTPPPSAFTRSCAW